MATAYRHRVEPGPSVPHVEVFTNKFIQQRAKAFDVGPMALASLLCGKARLDTTDLPSDTEVASIYLDPTTGRLTVLAFSDGFPPIADGSSIPQMSVAVIYRR